jgi:triosephosphate isomerase
MRKNIVAGNWKMNNDLRKTQILIKALDEKIKTSKTEVMIAPPFVNLQSAVKQLKDS